MSLIVRTESTNPASVIPAIRREIMAVDKDQPVHSFKPLDQSVAELGTDQRFSTTLLAAFAALAVLLATVGIYGVTSYAVAQRTHEIGVRLALGAKTGDVLRLVVGPGMLLAGIGIAIGLIGSLAVTRLLASLLYGVTATDPLTMIAVAALLALVALAACLIPARRAARIDPLMALRHE